MNYSQQAIKFQSKTKFVSKINLKKTSHIKTEEEWLKQEAYLGQYPLVLVLPQMILHKLSRGHINCLIWESLQWNHLWTFLFICNLSRHKANQFFWQCHILYNMFRSIHFPERKQFQVIQSGKQYDDKFTFTLEPQFHLSQMNGYIMFEIF